MLNVNITLNGISGTLWEIRRQEAIHFYLGYRQALLIIKDLEKNIKTAKLGSQKTMLAISKEKTALASSIPEEEESVRILELEIIQDSLVETNLLIRDSVFELEAAKAEKDRIETEHPELRGTYEEIQQKYAQSAFLAKLARNVAISTYALSQGLSEAASEIIVDSNCLSITDQEQLFALWGNRMQKILPPKSEDATIQSINLIQATETQNGSITGRN